MSDVNRKIAKGAGWMVLSNVTERLIGLVSILFLSRLLVPGDFGVVAVGSTMLYALEMMSAFSLDLALIQNESAERRHYDTAWTLNLVFRTATAIALVALAKPCAVFFAEPRAQIVMYCLGIGTFIEGFTNIGVVAFQKELQLDKDFRFGVSRKLAGFFVTLPLAYWLGNYWALMAGILATKVAGVILSYCLHPYRPRLCLVARHELLHFSKWMLLNNALISINTRGDDFIVGRMIGSKALGLYTMAYELSNLPTTELVWPISRAVFPGYSKLLRDKTELRGTFLRVMSLIALVTVPAGIGIGLVAEPLVLVVLGQKWMEVVPIITVCAIFGVARALHGPTGTVYLALGKPNLIFYLQLLNVVVVIPMLIFLVYTFGTIGAPWALLVAVMVSMPTNYVWVMRELRLPLAQLVGVLWRPLVSATLMYAAGTWLLRMLPTSVEFGPNLSRLLVVVSMGALTYVVAVLLFWRLSHRPEGAEHTLLALLKTRVSRLR